MTKQISLTRGYVALVDDNDYAWLSQNKWLVVGPGYAGRFDRTGSKPKLIYMHRAILDAQSKQRVDHINANKLDNRRENLRIVTNRQNHQNRTPRRDTSSDGRKGVSWHKHTGKWYARIMVNGQRVHLGYFKGIEGATLLYDAAARHFFGEYARPNCPDKSTPPEIAGLLAYVLSHRTVTYPVLKQLATCQGQCAMCRRGE